MTGHELLLFPVINKRNNQLWGEMYNKIPADTVCKPEFDKDKLFPAGHNIKLSNTQEKLEMPNNAFYSRTTKRCI